MIGLLAALADGFGAVEHVVRGDVLCFDRVGVAVTANKVAGAGFAGQGWRVI